MQQRTVEYLPGMSTTEFAAQVREALLGSHLVVTRGVDYTVDQRPFWDEVSELAGNGCYEFAEDYRTGKQVGEKWMEIRYDGSIQNAYRYSKNAQPMHTDGSYIPDGPEVVFFYCIRQAARGGETTFIDGPELVELLARIDPGLLADLRATPVHFSKADNHKTRPIIDEAGGALRFAWNYYCVDPSERPEVKQLAERFHGFCEREIAGPQRVRPVRLQPGEAVFFHDERLLHGRNAFDASQKDDRFLLKTAFNVTRAAPGT